MMKQRFFIALMAASLLAVGCAMGSNPGNPENLDNTGTDNTGAPVYKYAQGLWGEWVRMDTDETWYISGNSIKIDNAVSSRAVTLNKQSDRVIEASEGGQTYYLYASRIANASFTGRVVGFGQPQQSKQGAPVQKTTADSQGWIDVVINDLDNGSTTTVTTDGDGAFTVPNAIPGDEYKITPEGGAPVTVTPAADGVDIGTITVSDEVSFKTTIVPQSGYSYDMNELYAGTSYNFTLTVRHTGTVNCTAATYEIDPDDGLSVAGNLDDMFRTIEPGTTRTVGLTISCAADAIPQDKVFKKIRIAITDNVSGKIYEDSVSLKFHKKQTIFSIRCETERGISGVLIAPTGKTYSFTNTTSKDIVTPWLVDDYLLVFSGATVATEAIYSFTVDGTPDTNYTAFRDLGNYEPNNTEDAASRLGGKEKVMSYLWVNDIDYYQINLNITNVAPGQPTVTAGDQQITVSWSEVAEATAYEVWYGTVNNSAEAQKYGEDVTGLSTTIIGLTKGTAYYVWVKAKRGQTLSGFSPSATGTTVPAAPVISSVTAGSGQLTVSWGAVTGASSYKLYYNTSDDSGSAAAVNGVTSPYTLTGLSKGTAYYIWVKAVNAAGESGFSAVAVAVATSPTSLAARFGLSEPTNAAGVTAVFNAVHDYLAENPTAPDIALGNWVDLPSLTVADWGTNTLPNGNGSLSGGVTNTPINSGINGYSLRLIVVGKNSFKSGTGSYTVTANDATPHLVFQFQNIPGVHAMEATSTNQNGYAGSEMRAYLVPVEGKAGSGTFLAGLTAAGVPDSVLFAPKRYVANKGSGATGADLIEDKLWLPTEREMFGARTYSSSAYETAANQGRLEYYTNNSLRQKYSSAGSNAAYWTSSPYSGYSTHFCLVGTSGAASGYYANFVYGVVPAFCVR